SFAMCQGSAGKGGSVREAGNAVQFGEISSVLIACLKFGVLLGQLAVRCFTAVLVNHGDTRSSLAKSSSPARYAELARK
ncbi:MAG: hypothetical protein DI584_09935, partial [Stenotrophomonas sp.]